MENYTDLVGELHHAITMLKHSARHAHDQADAARRLRSVIEFVREASK